MSARDLGEPLPKGRDPILMVGESYRDAVERLSGEKRAVELDCAQLRIRVHRADRTLRDVCSAVGPLCPCDPTPETTDWHRKCPMHGEPDVARAEMRRLRVMEQAAVALIEHLESEGSYGNDAIMQWWENKRDDLASVLAQDVRGTARVVDETVGLMDRIRERTGGVTGVDEELSRLRVRAEQAETKLAQVRGTLKWIGNEDCVCDQEDDDVCCPSCGARDALARSEGVTLW